MNRFTHTAAIAILSLPLVAAAQTTTTTPSTTPSSKLQNAETPRSNLEKQQTESVGDATKYGQEGSGSSSQVNHKDNKKMKKAKKTTDTTTTDSTTK
jgi:hypothetical protein